MECKHAKPYYTVKRMRLLEYLMRHGFTPFTRVADPNNPKYSWWLFENTPELERCVEIYFAELGARKTS
jgi:hypothetical protein